MNNRIKTNTLMAILLSGLVQNVMANEATTLTIDMDGLDSDQGQAIFILMDSEFSHQGKLPVYIKSAKPIEGGKSQMIFTGIPSGDYSAVIYHDVNNNGELDRTFYGMPTEPYGFSNNARGSFGPPDFAESLFHIDDSASHLTITVK
ncbi:MAG: DUF2141 domain-containing protein [Halopseudomonas sp.]